MSISKRKIRDGEHLVVCDRTGFTVWSGDTTREYTGLRVRRGSDEPRHPQEFVRGVPDGKSVRDPRPRGVDELLGPLETTTTAAASAGDTDLSVESSVRFEAGDRLSVLLSSGDSFKVNLQAALSSTSIRLAEVLPGPVDNGATIVNFSATAEADTEL